MDHLDEVARTAWTDPGDAGLAVGRNRRYRFEEGFEHGPGFRAPAGHERGTGADALGTTGDAHGFKVTAFDLSDEAVKSTRGWAERENLDIETYTGNMLSLPFQNNSFDCIIAYNVIYHTDMTGFGTILNEIQRILRPGGEMFLTLISKSTWSFTHANKAQKLDKNTILRNENEAGEDVPHFYVDIQDIKHFFTNFEFVRLPVEEHDYDIENPNKYSVHWKFIVKKKN